MNGTLKKYLKLGGWIFGIWFFFWIFTPLWVAKSQLHQDFARYQDENNIPTGALYYNDLPFMRDAEIHLRDAWRFTPRRKAAQ